MIEVVTTPAHGKNIAKALRDGFSPCAVCGKAIADDKVKMGLHLNGYGQAMTEAEGKDCPPNADLGFYALGADCLRNNPQLLPYVIRS